MKVGDYVRTKNGIISKIKEIHQIVTTDNEYITTLISHDIGTCGEENVINYSQNIIDLIEVGDYVNGVLVESIYQREKDKLYIHSFDTEIMICVTNNNIETIVTKEQFEVMQYKVGE